MAEQAVDDGEDEQEVERAHLEGLEDGCGCAEVWEHLSDEEDVEDAGEGQSTE
ncbi:hypothetical protein [Halobaculum limi]|uniref:hypothetical protein n=1 Tax=Halobaculum limi TaxID=3031916 RepID=UPI002405B4B4|nr:hypothetical protein [Halobaculum sp. YSMS11]